MKSYLSSIKEEQAKARIQPKKATPIFLDKVKRLAVHIYEQLQSPSLAPIAIYIYSRDLCFFTVDFFSGDRSSDLGRVLAQETLFFPDRSGILFNQRFGKTLRGNTTNAFAVRRCRDPALCPVLNLERYLAVCKLLKIDLSAGFLFRSTKGKQVLDEAFAGSAVHSRLKSYLRALDMDRGETPHSFRSGCSITLALLGIPKEAIAQHIGWSNISMVDHYNDLGQVLTANPAANALAACASGIDLSQTAELYKAWDDISAFTPAVPPSLGP